MADQMFTISQVAVAAHVTVGKLNGWIPRGLMNFGDDPGKGRARKFTLEDAVKLRLLSELTQRGMLAIAAAEVVRKFDLSIALFIRRRSWEKALILSDSINAASGAQGHHEDSIIILIWYNINENETMRQDIMEVSKVADCFEQSDERGPISSAILVNLSIIARDVQERLSFNH